jgi:multidrug resistance efflux pump
MGNVNKALEERIKALKESHKDSDKDAVIAVLAETELAKEKAEADLTNADKDIEALNAQLSEFESGKKKAPKHPTLKVKNVEYLVTRGIQIKDQKYTAQEVADNTETIDGLKLGEWLIKKRSGILKPKA